MYIFSLENFLNVILPNELKFSLIDFYIGFIMFVYAHNSIIINYLSIYWLWRSWLLYNFK